MRALAFDTETTGLTRNRKVALDKQPEVIEYCGILFDLDSGKIERESEMLIKPSITKKLPDEIVKITGITDNLLANAEPFTFHAKQIKDELEKADLVIAHNVTFDREMIDIEMERLGKAIQWPETLCTVEASKSLTGRFMKLSSLYTHLFGEAFSGAHRALVDTKALVRIALKLKEMGAI